MGLTCNTPLPKVSLAFESVGLNQVPNHICIPTYQVVPLDHAGINSQCIFGLVNIVSQKMISMKTILVVSFNRDLLNTVQD